VEPGALAPVERWVADRRAAWEDHLDRLGDHLAAEESSE